jgi:hypothetical protein
MICFPSSPAQRRFTVRMWIEAGLCMLFALVAALAFRFGHLSGMLAYPVAILPTLPILGTLVLTGTYLAEETDEFQRNLLIQSLLGGIGVTLSATTVCGYLERFAHAWHFDPILVYPVFWLSTAASYAVVWLRYR